LHAKYVRPAPLGAAGGAQFHQNTLLIAKFGVFQNNFLAGVVKHSILPKGKNYAS
jgi:hypothetical protein